jgi:hypothetical protein
MVVQVQMVLVQLDLVVEVVVLELVQMVTLHQQLQLLGVLQLLAAVQELMVRLLLVSGIMHQDLEEVGEVHGQMAQLFA